MYTLIIKGDKTAAFAACRLHNVEITSIVKHNKFDECIVTTASRAEVTDLLGVWFCAATGPAPYPVGTLMWYGPREIGLPYKPGTVDTEILDNMRQGLPPAGVEGSDNA